MPYGLSTSHAPGQSIASADVNAIASALNNLGIGFYNVLDYSAPTQAQQIQAAIDAADAYLGGGSYTAGQRGGVVFLPATASGYTVDRDLFWDARIRFVGQLGVKAGGKSSQIKATTGGPGFNTGGYPDKFVLKNSRQTASGATAYWGHSSSLECVSIDCNSVSGLAGVHWYGAGENSLMDRVEVTNSGVTARTVTDAVFTANSATITSATAAFTQDDVLGTISSPVIPTYTLRTVTDAVITSGSTTITSATANFTSTDKYAEVAVSGVPATAYITAINSTTSITVSAASINTATGRTLTIRQPRDYRVRAVLDATTAYLTRPVRDGGSAQSLTINRPRPGIQAHGWGATGLTRSVDVSGNSGAGFEIVQGGSWNQLDVSGDDNGCLFRVRETGQGADPTKLRVTLKAESNQTGTGAVWGNHDPVGLIDNCGMLHVDVDGLAAANVSRASVDLIRIEQTAFTDVSGTGGPVSLVLRGVSATNPFNNSFENLIKDYSTGRALTARQLGDTRGLHPDVHWNHEVVVAGTQGGFRNELHADPAGQQVGARWRIPISTWAQPSVVQSGSWTVQLDGSVILTTRAFSANALTDDHRWYVDTSGGTWKLIGYAEKGAALGISTWDISFDGGTTWTSIGTFDHYNASTTKNNPYTSSTFTVPTTGRAILRLTTPTKNASSTAFNAVWNALELVRTV